MFLPLFRCFSSGAGDIVTLTRSHDSLKNNIQYQNCPNLHLLPKDVVNISRGRTKNRMKGKPFTMDRAPIDRPRGVLPRAIVTLVRVTPRDQSEGGEGGGGEERIFRGSHMVLWGNGERTRRRQHSIKRGQFFIPFLQKSPGKIFKDKPRAGIPRLRVS